MGRNWSAAASLQGPENGFWIKEAVLPGKFEALRRTVWGKGAAASLPARITRTRLASHTPAVGPRLQLRPLRSGWRSLTAHQLQIFTGFLARTQTVELK